MSTQPTGTCRLVMHVPLAAALALAAPSFAQPALYSNSGGAVTNPGLATGSSTGSGVAAAPGTMWSELQGDAMGATNSRAGFSLHDCDAAGAYRLADDFAFTGDAWTLSSVSVYAYQTSGAPTVTSVNLRVWNGPPGEAGSTVVWGDTTTNRLLSVTTTNVSRAFNTLALPAAPLPDSSRPIVALNLGVPGAVLQPGTYWLDWQARTTPSGMEVSCPPVTLLGTRSKAGSNARQFVPTPTGGSWTSTLDAGKPLSAPDVAQDLPFIIYGYSGTPPCPSDFNADGFVNGIDFDQFVAAFEAGDLATDFNHDGFVNGIDFDSFTVAFESGC